MGACRPFAHELRHHAAAVLAMVAAAAPAAAQVATDGSLGTARLLNGPNTLVPAALGRTAGANLFHSFSYFSVARGESVTFTDLGGIANVIARVTGGARSEIFGPVRVEGNAANLFLVNPAGFLFGLGASLNVPAAFYAVGAHEVRFADGTRFTTRLADGVTLTAAAPAAFGFREAGGGITVSGATLATRPGTTLGLVGGGVLLERGAGSGLLSAPAGHVALVALGGAGTVTLDGSADGAANGRIAILNGTRVSVAEAANASTGSGRISIRGGDIVIDHARLDANTRRGAGGAIDIEASGTLIASGAEVLAVTVGAGHAGTIRMSGREVVVDAGSLVDASCDPGCTTGNAGALDIVASQRITIAGENAAPTNVVSNSFGGGAAGRVSLAAPRIDIAGASFVQSVGLAAGDSRGVSIDGERLTITGGAQVAASSRGSGRGGAIDITVDELLLSGYRNEAGTGQVLRSGVFANAEGSGNAGEITVRASNVRVLGGAEISSSATARSTGAGGTVRLLLDGELEIAGFERRDAQGDPVGPSAVVTNTFGPGRGGNIEIAARSVVLRDHGLLQSQSEGRGDAGRIRLDVTDLRVTSRGALSSRAGGTGHGGSIQVRAAGTVELRGANTGIFAETDGDPQGARAGSGGSIDIQASELRMAEGAVIFSSTKGSGDGGPISVRAGHIHIDADSRLASESTGTSALLAAAPGLAGDISMVAERTLALEGAITTRTNEADGGNVDVRVGDLAVLRGGRITTAVGTGLGDGGNVEVAAPTLVMLDAIVNANAFGGSGGNIHIAAPGFIFSPRSVLTASSELGIDGVIQVESPALDVAGVLGAPVPRYLQGDLVLAGRCQARLAGRASALAFAAPREAFRPGGRGFLMPSAAALCSPPPTGVIPR